MATESDNGGLYFIVGGLVVVVAVLGFLYVNNGNMSSPDVPNVIEKTERTIERTTETNNNDKSSVEFRADENGVSATSKQSD